jgi:radical SAM protein with 4Fe4S-binding SPASM domain
MLDRVYIEISNICNLQCSFCPVVERDNEVMSLNDFKKVFSQAQPLAKEVCLHLMGEPLAHPEFEEIIKYCESQKAVLKITTNGINLHKFPKLLASDCIKQINFSVQSYKDNFPNKPLAPYMQMLTEFTTNLHNLNPNTYFNFRLWNDGVVGNENDEVFDLIENYYNVIINRKVDVASIKSKKIIEKIYLHFDSRFEWPSLDQPFQGETGRCHGVKGHIGIHADGTVVPCCLDKEAVIKLGNVFENDLNNILENERTSRMREGFAQNILVEDLCKHCSYINRFKK